MADVSAWQIGLTAVVGLVTGYVGSVLTENRKRKHETRVLALSLSYELGALAQQYGKTRSVLLGDEPRQVSPWKKDEGPDFPVYEANLSRLGLLSSLTVQALDIFYRAAGEAQLIVRWMDTLDGEHSDFQALTDARARAEKLLVVAMEAADLCLRRLEFEGVPWSLVAKEIGRVFAQSLGAVWTEHQERQGRR